MNEGFSGEPMSAGASGRSRGVDLEVRFPDAVDLSRVRALLALARERAGAPVERVLTLNLIGIHYSDASWEKGQVSLEAVSSLHPARIVGLVALPNEAENLVTARVAVSRPKGAPFFVERIVLRATGKSVRRLDSSLDGLLVPDVPIVVVWGGRVEGALLKRAIDSADRLIVDSGSRPAAALLELDALVKRGAPVGDISWARIFPWQCLAAEVLDIPNLREHRGNISAARITTNGPPGPEALLLAGWFQSRVKRARVTLVAGTPSPEVAGSELSAPAPGQVTELQFTAAPAEFVLRREKNGILDAQVRGDDDGEVVHRLRLPPETPGGLLVQELKLLAGCDEIYAAALDEAARFAAALIPAAPAPVAP